MALKNIKAYLPDIINKLTQVSDLGIRQLGHML